MWEGEYVHKLNNLIIIYKYIFCKYEENLSHKTAHQYKRAVTTVTANVYVYIFLYISIYRFLLIRLYVRHIMDLG